jgi:hypothetical protein
VRDEMTGNDDQSIPSWGQLLFFFLLYFSRALLIYELLLFIGFYGKNLD